MTEDSVETEARRDHYQTCRRHHPELDDTGIADNWQFIGDTGRDDFRQAAVRKLAKEHR